MILSTSHISRHLILSVLIILIFLVIVPYKRREILGYNINGSSVESVRRTR